MESLISFDHWLFGIINHDWSNGLFDWLMPRITDLHKSPYFLGALLPLIAFWVWKQRTYALKCLLVLIMAVGLSDLTSYRVIKATVQRDRPVEAGLSVDLRTHHHSGTSFPSNHAANIFAAAQTMSLALPQGWPIYYLIAFAVAYSRVYVGVHFPMDVTCGGLLGVAFATLIWVILRKWIKNGGGSSRARN